MPIACVKRLGWAGRPLMTTPCELISLFVVFGIAHITGLNLAIKIWVHSMQMHFRASTVVARQMYFHCTTSLFEAGEDYLSETNKGGVSRCNNTILFLELSRFNGEYQFVLNPARTNQARQGPLRAREKASAIVVFHLYVMWVAPVAE